MTSRTELFQKLIVGVSRAAALQDDTDAAIDLLTEAKERINEIGDTYIVEIEAALKAEA